MKTLQIPMLVVAILALAISAFAQSPDTSKMKPGEMAVVKIDKADLDEIESIRKRIAELHNQIAERVVAVEAKHNLSRDDFYLEWIGDYILCRKWSETKHEGNSFFIDGYAGSASREVRIESANRRINTERKPSK